MKKRVLSILLTLVMLIGMMPLAAIPAFAEGNTVSYLDEYGRTQSRAAADVTEITWGKEYGAGWYILSGVKSMYMIIFSGETHLILADDADVTVSGGILLNGDNASLTIYGQTAGTGKLTVQGVPDYRAGIGSGERASCGDITIGGGTVTATGGDFGAGIGSGWHGSCGNVTIGGGTVTATGGNWGGASIGSGNNGSCGDITVSGGTVTAAIGEVTELGGNNGAGIGSGREGSCGNITISGGCVTANGGYGSAGIGSANVGTCADITIGGGRVTATGGYNGAGIGSGMGKKWSTSSHGTIRITDGIVTAIGGEFGAGIGTGYEGSFDGGITISGGYIKAKAGENAKIIGAGYGGTCGTVDYGSCQTKDKDGWRYVNYELFAGTEATCMEAGSKEYYQCLPNEAYYSALPFTEETLIPDLDEWMAEGNPGYIAPLGHYDNNGDGLCDCCSLKIYETVAAVQPTCTEAGHIAYVANYLNGLFYTDLTFTDDLIIGDETDLAKWMAEGGDGYIAPIGHKNDNGDKLCDRCGAYIYYDFDPSTWKMTEYFHTASEVDSSTSTMNDGWYVVKGNVEIEGSLYVNGDVILILTDDATLTVKKGILLTEGNSLTICVQSFGNHTGSLIATGAGNAAGIGGYVDSARDERFSSGRLTINGGKITATGAIASAGIGGSEWTDCGEVTINEGTVTANGGGGGAGIGGGLSGNLTKLTINGGTVTAKGGYGGAGIGGGLGGDGGQVQINRGYIMLYGGEESAAFGKEYLGDGTPATVRIGSNMEAYEIIDRPLSYDPSRTKEVLGDQLTVNADGTLDVKTYFKVVVRATVPNDGPVTPTDPDEHQHLAVLAMGLAPTEDTAGYQNYYWCYLCKKCFEDKACTIEITDLDAWKAKGGNGYIAPLNETVEYTVTFNMNGHGSQIAAQSVTEGGNASMPADPTASGYTFKGWYADASFSAEFDFDTPITADTTIYAKWVKNTDPTTPKTGDNSHMALWIALLVLSGGALVGTMGYGRKRKNVK